ncbi:hypothetical protein, conserved [Babesia bigemina]|uniref:SH3 domain-containing protein n=1 Tax=Babesia bigemina TaxID=5866 RepID=A0A061D737_BABBI|nr:hypothetical protein, conserved [Babesia bigemina]CDR94734.1 hypothetical protein, conserved [Babesia bigemina]|eukprot:XP_012766920.1 hypothetical protein, conserved [Babesia bigemina]
MLDVCRGANQNHFELDAPLQKLIIPLSLMARGKRDSAHVCKTLDSMDKSGHGAIIGAGQRRKDIDTASTSPESNSINPDYGAAYAWSNSAHVTDLKDVKGGIGAKAGKRSSWEVPGWATAQSDMTTNSGTNNGSDDTAASFSKRVPDGMRFKSDTGGLFRHRHSAMSSEGPEMMFPKAPRASSFSGMASYGGGAYARFDAGPDKAYYVDSAHDPALAEAAEQLSRYAADLRRKRGANAKYPHEATSYTNNKYAYERGPLGFATVFRDTESDDVVRSDTSTMPLTIFSAYTPLRLEDGAIAVQPSDKVDLLARHKHWLYVRVAKSRVPESVGRSGWIPEETLLEPELFSRRLLHTGNRTHMFNKFL